MRQLAQYLLIFFSGTTLCAQPDLSPKTVQVILGNLLSIARDPLSDGSELMDTVAGRSAYETNYITSLRYPGAVETIIDRAPNTWNKDSVTVRYTWQCVLMKAEVTDATAFTAEEAKLVDAINQTLPGVQPDSTKTWITKQGTRVSLHRWVQSPYKVDDQLVIRVYVVKKVRGNRQANIDHILSKYTAAAALTNSTSTLTAYARTAYFRINAEGLSYEDAMTAALPLLQALATKNLRAVYNVLTRTPSAASPILMAALTPAQKQGMSDMAQGIINAFNDSQNGTGATATTTTATPRQPGIIAYNQMFKDTVKNQYVYILSFSELTGLYRIQTCYWRPKDKYSGPSLGKQPAGDVGESFFSSRHWVAVSAGACYSCNGAGITFTSTPYSYNYSEKGIYNTYSYSGSGTNVTKHTCTACGGSGFSECYLK